MKKFMWLLVALTLSAAVAILVIAIRNGLIPWEQVEGALAKGFAALVGLAFALGATLPLSYRGKRVKRIRGYVTYGPLTSSERRHNRRMWIASMVILAAVSGLVAWWQIFAHGDSTMTAWALYTQAVAYIVLIPIHHPVELDQIKAPQSPGQMFWAVSDPSAAILVGE